MNHEDTKARRETAELGGLVCRLALEDGSIFCGEAFGACGTQVGEVVFNTSMTGYQEIFTDPSYCGQIVTMTYPLIGNYGVNHEDFESGKPALSGYVVKELPRRPSNFRATSSLPEFLNEHGIIGLAGVDTRALTRRIRTAGAMRAVLSTEVDDEIELVRLARDAASMAGADLVRRVVPRESVEWSEPLGALHGAADAAGADLHVVALDCGIKHNILRHLASAGCRVTVLPGTVGADAVREQSADGLLVGNGPGDPAAVRGTIDTLRSLLGELPIFGICLGHQMLALALGAETYKLRFGHHGANLPVRNEFNGRVEITSQNHGFAVDAASLLRSGAKVSHINLNDQSLEGFIHPDKRMFAVQYHPEASPGPHDAGYLFDRFVDVVRTGRSVDESLLGG